jgi:iron complex transport system substrate-binding protein
MPTRPRFRRRHARGPIAAISAVAAASAAVLLLAGCAGGADAGDDPEATTGAAASGYPLTIDNCGTEVTFEQAPERVVTIKSSTLELLLALGLDDRVVGAAFTDGPAPEEYAEAVDGIEILTAEGAGDRATLEQLGVHTYVAPAACQAEGYQPDPLTFDGVLAGFEEAGAIFDVEDAAADLVAEQQAALDAIAPSDAGLTALWYSSGDDQPFVGAGTGAPQMIMEAAGLENVVGDVRDSWTSLSWEAVVDANPDVIVLVDAAWNTAESKIAKLEGNPATAALPAVQQARYVIVDFPATEAGVRNVDAVASIVEQLEAF